MPKGARLMLRQEEIIEILRDNEWVAFGGLPKEVQEWVWNDQLVTYWDAYDEEWYTTAGVDVGLMDIIRLTKERAKELLDALSKPKPKGRWVEYPVDDKGYYCGRQRNGRPSSWTNAPLANVLGIFGGWLWVHETKSEDWNFWSTDRYGFCEDNRLTKLTHLWVRPVMPKAVRFYIES